MIPIVLPQPLPLEYPYEDEPEEKGHMDEKDEGCEYGE
jgi:hypothetical protein